MGQIFKIQFKQNWFDKNTILETNGHILEVLETPYRKWWKVLLQYISFGFYKAPYQHKVKLINNKKIC